MRLISNSSLAVLLGCHIAIFAAGATATPSYVGVNVAKLAENPEDPTFAAIAYGRFGAFINPYASVEWRLGTGVADGSYRLGQVTFDNTNVDLFYGAYLRGGLPLGRFTPYISVGYTWFDVQTVGVSTQEDSEDRLKDISFGTGVDFAITSNIQANLEYQQYINDAPLRINGVSLGVSYIY